MASKFYAVFGVCRDKGGTKKACYNKAVKAVSGRSKRKKSRKKAKSRRRRCEFGVHKYTGACLKHPRRPQSAREKRRKACCAACG